VYIASDLPKDVESARKAWEFAEREWRSRPGFTETSIDSRSPAIDARWAPSTLGWELVRPDEIQYRALTSTVCTQVAGTTRLLHASCRAYQADSLKPRV
jgi:hypothetical protein